MTENTPRQYTLLFNSELGQEVLKDLQKIWKEQPASLEQNVLAHTEGRRQVVRYIETMIEKGSKEE